MAEVNPRSILALVRRVVMFEVRLYRSLIRWVARRPDVPAGEAFGYAKLTTPVMWLWIFGSAIEMPVAHLVIPWDPVRIAALVVGVWGLLWMVGLLASLNVYPHLLDDTTLRVRHGASTDITIPLDAIASITVQRRDLPSSIRTLQPRETDGGIDLQVGVSGEVNVHTVLRKPMTVPMSKGSLEITELSFLADEPRVLVARVRQNLDASPRARRSA